METTGTLAGIFEFKQRVRAAGSDGKFKRQGGEGALEGQDSSQPVVRWRTYQFFAVVSFAGLRTTPWIGCGPKCVVAGPPKTNVMLELVTEYLISSPPVTQT